MDFGDLCNSLKTNSISANQIEVQPTNSQDFMRFSLEPAQFIGRPGCVGVGWFAALQTTKTDR
jgi:hypothetical protein